MAALGNPQASVRPVKIVALYLHCNLGGLFHKLKYSNIYSRYPVVAMTFENITGYVLPQNTIQYMLKPHTSTQAD